MKDQKTGYWITIYGIVAVLLVAIYYLVNLDIFISLWAYRPVIQKLSLSLFVITMTFLLRRIISRVIINSIQTEGDRYNLLRITRFLAIVFSLIVVGSFLFQNLYTAAATFGLITLVLGFALQAPITSFIAWVYLIFRRSYLVGDRIQINGMRGDVVEINYLDTSILECSGDYLEIGRASCRERV